MINLKWRCSWSSTDRWCSHKFISYLGATYIRDLTVLVIMQVIAWCWTGDKLFSEPMITQCTATPGLYELINKVEVWLIQSLHMLRCLIFGWDRFLNLIASVFMWIFNVRTISYLTKGLYCQEQDFKIHKEFSKLVPAMLGKSLRPSDAIWRQIWVNIGSSNGLLPDGTKPLPEPMMTSHQ